MNNHLGFFLEHSVYWVFASSTDNASQEAIQSVLLAYQQEGGNLWEGMELRVVAFIGETLLNIQIKQDFKFNGDLARKVMETGASFLAQGIKQVGDGEGILCEAIHDFSR